MIWLKRILMIIGALALLTYFFPAQREQLGVSVKHIFKQDTPPLVSTQKITVYQSQGNKGEAVFSDRQNMAHTARTRVVDNAKGTTTHIDIPKKDEKSSSVLNFNEENARFQKQAQQIQQARMERAIAE